MESALTPLPSSFYHRDTEEVARDLLGRWVVRRIDGKDRILRIVETEAYLGCEDRASHAWNGRRTPRVESLYLEGGHAYVYLIYGIHHCLNVVTGIPEIGSAVLLRAGEPLEGQNLMIRSRKLDPSPKAGAIAGGPGKLCQALEINLDQDGLRFEPPRLFLSHGTPVSTGRVLHGPRIGIDYAGEAVKWPLRFGLEGNPHLSQPFKNPR